jgi:hypothetical protein
MLNKISTLIDYVRKLKPEPHNTKPQMECPIHRNGQLFRTVYEEDKKSQRRSSAKPYSRKSRKGSRRKNRKEVNWATLTDSSNDKEDNNRRKE